MAIRNLINDSIPGTAIAVLAVLTLIAVVRYCFSKPSFPKNAPPMTYQSYPLLGSLQVFTQRWEFYRSSSQRSRTGNFSFYAGQWPVIGIGTDEGRRVYFESKEVGFNEGYAALFGGGPESREDNNPLTAPSYTEDGFNGFFSKRLHHLLKPNRLKESIPVLIADTRDMLDDLMINGQTVTDPFVSIYRIVFLLTMRMVACNEIADDPVLVTKTLHLFECIEKTATPLSIMFPWMLTPAKIKRMYYGGQLYMMLQRIVNDRERHNQTEDDALQYLLDQKDSLTLMITFICGSLFAGQLNTGVNAAWILIYLATSPEWMNRVRAEIQSVADQYSDDQDKSLKERLAELPAEAWSTSFPTIDVCLKESIRLIMPGTGFRKNIFGSDIPLDQDATEVIPKDAYVALSTSETFQNPEIFANPDEWDPSRYGPDRAEDKKKLYGYWGWGHSRHPCAGMGFAKLEVNVIVAFFLAYFDEIEVVDQNGAPTTKLPPIDKNRHTAHVPDERVWLKCRERELRGPNPVIL